MKRLHSTIGLDTCTAVRRKCAQPTGWVRLVFSYLSIISNLL
jgi:hypothetical protein